MVSQVSQCQIYGENKGNAKGGGEEMTKRAQRAKPRRCPEEFERIPGTLVSEIFQISRGLDFANCKILAGKGAKKCN